MTRFSTTAIVMIGMLIPFTFSGSSHMAGPLYVGPAGNDANNCLSPPTACLTIQAAVNKAADGDQILVAPGTYAGSVTIFSRYGLRISGPGAAISDPGLPNGAAVVIIQASTNILLDGLSFSGNPSGVEAIRVFSSTAISITNAVIERANLGIFSNNSGVNVADSTIQDNGTGIRVDAESSVALQSTPFSLGTSVVQRNGNGILVRSGTFGLQGATIVDSNGIGLNGTGGQIRTCCADGLRKISNNGTGIQTTGVNLELRGPIEMEGNRNFAIRMFAGVATVADRVTMRNNGRADTAGIVMTGGHLQLNGVRAGDVQISDNAGGGVLLTDAASGRISNTAITGNGSHGVRIQALSVAQLLANAVFTGNGGFDFSCTPNSFGRGDKSGVGKMFCSGFDQSPNPDPGGPIAEAAAPAPLRQAPAPVAPVHARRR